MRWRCDGPSNRGVAQEQRIALARPGPSLNDDEIRTMWQAWEGLNPLFGVQFKLHLLTAQRGGELRTMRWEDVDLASACWTIPAHIAKNGLAHRVPLSPPAQQLLEGLHALFGTTAYVFPSPVHESKPTSSSKVKLVMSDVRDNAGISFVQHDLRRTAASHMTSMGIPRLVVGKILNHAELGVTAVYDRHSYDDQKRDALDRWGRKVMAIVGEGDASNVIPMRREAVE